ncbi:MAG: UvrB/UvrC motif-containing protein [Candidatus Kariarchaeaceae archaeon]|jgi:excinuclease ABC subunit C
MMDIFKQLRDIPETPGVYLIRDKDSKVIYVARANNLKEKIRNHLVSKESNRNKMIAKYMRSVDVEVFDSKIDATRRELELIQEHYPALNGPRKGIKQYRFVKVFHDEDFPRARKKKYIEEDDEVILGPFPKTHHIQVVLSVAANHYRIADCGKEVILGDDHKIVQTCIRRQTRQCMRPCEVEVDADEYRTAMEGFISFFQGDDPELVEHLEAEMGTHVSNQNFEQAAKIRDYLKAIGRLGLK